jgi:DUF3047 family protein
MSRRVGSHGNPRRPTAGRHRVPRGCVLLVACVTAVSLLAAGPTYMEAAPMPAPFSSGQPGFPFPRGWEAVKLSDRKRPTAYSLTQDGDNVVLHAHADAAASGLAQFTRFDIRSAPIVEWRWKVSALVEGADNRIAAKEDSPARLIFAFDGNKASLPLLERSVFYIAEKLSGRELPYALLQYVWAREIPVGTILEHPYTRRVRLLVVASGSGGVGRWHSMSRNLHDDFRRAFHEEPGLLTGVGVLTDTDNTGGSVEAWYGDIQFRAER